jgi:hypothetical protein
MNHEMSNSIFMMDLFYLTDDYQKIPYFNMLISQLVKYMEIHNLNKVSMYER